MKVLGYKRRAINWEKVCCPSYAVQSNNGEGFLARLHLGGNNPHTSVRIRGVPMARKPVDEGAGVLYTCRRGEGKEEQDTSNDHAFHAWLVCVCLDEYSVMARVRPMPVGVRPDPLAMHAARTTKIARGIEPSNCGVVNKYTAVKVGAMVKGYVGRRDIRFGMELLIEEAPEKGREFRLIDVGSEGR